MHYSVIVRLEYPEPIESEDDLKAKLEDVLEPYNEEPSEERFLVWRDREAEYLQEYLEGEQGYVRDAAGKLALAFREDPTVVKIANCVRYPSFEDYMDSYHGIGERDRWYQRYGEWHNPNGRWDWWSIGGRWDDLLRDKNGVGRNYARYAELDMDYLEREMVTRARAFWQLMERGIAGKSTEEERRELRSTALDKGLMRLRDGSVKTPCELDPDEVLLPPWPERIEMRDEILQRFESESAFLEHARMLFHPLKAWAILDEEGWHEASYGSWDLEEGGGRVRRDLRREQALKVTERLFRNPRPEHVLVMIDIHR